MKAPARSVAGKTVCERNVSVGTGRDIDAELSGVGEPAIHVDHAAQKQNVALIAVPRRDIIRNHRGAGELKQAVLLYGDRRWRGIAGDHASVNTDRRIAGVDDPL